MARQMIARAASCAGRVAWRASDRRTAAQSTSRPTDNSTCPGSDNGSPRRRLTKLVASVRVLLVAGFTSGISRVAAAEEVASRRVRERKATRRPQDDRRRRHSARRTAERAVAEAEQCVGERERRVADLRARLEDPAMYLAPDGAARAHRLGAELEEARIELEAAFAAWEAATRMLEGSG